MEFERWLSNDRQIVCKSNIDEVDQCAAAMKVITLDSLPSPLPTSRRQNDSSSAKSTCSEEDVVKYFKKKRRYTQKREENGTNDGEKAGIILTNVNTMAYKSLCGTTNGANKNDKREAPTSTWTPIDEIVEVFVIVDQPRYYFITISPNTAGCAQAIDTRISAQAIDSRTTAENQRECPRRSED